MFRTNSISKLWFYNSRRGALIMNITSAKYASNENKSVNAVIEGVTWAVPVDTSNNHYQEILKWVDAGNTIEEAE